MSGCRKAPRDRAGRITNVLDGDRCNNGKRPQVARHLRPELRRPSLAQEVITRWRIAAVQRSIDQGPEFAYRHCGERITAKEPRSNLEQDASTKTEALALRRAPWKWFEFGHPCVFEPRQLASAYAAGKELACNGLEARLGRRLYADVKLVEPLAPPREPNGTEPRVTARRYDVGESKVESPERRERRTNAPRQLLERDLAVVVEPAISDNRPPLLPPPPRTP